MTKEQEAQQAQTIEKLRSAGRMIEIMLDMSPNIPTPDKGEIRDYIKESCKIVDSQAQKIAEQGKEIERLKRINAEQTKELNKVRSLAFQIIGVTSGTDSKEVAI